MPDPNAIYCGINAIAKRLGINESTVRQWLKAGKFPSARKNGKGCNAPWVLTEVGLTEDMATFHERI